MLGKVVDVHQRDWDERLPYVMAAYRASCHEATGFSPNYLIFGGKENRAPLDIVFGHVDEPDGERPTYSAYAQDMLERMEDAYRMVRESLKKAAERRRHRYDLRVKPQTFQVGEWAWYFTPRRFKGRTPKWQRNFTGPFMIVGVSGPINYWIQKSQKAKAFVAHVIKLRPCYGRRKGEWVDRPESPDEGRGTEERPVISVIDRPRRTIRQPVRFQ